MILLIGRFVNERTYKTKKDFVVRELSIQEEGQFSNTIVQCSPDMKISPDKNGVVEIPVRFSAWDDRIKKFTNKSVKINAVAAPKSSKA